MIYWLGWFFFYVVFSILYRREVSGLENLPAEGSYILAANHLSYADPPLVGTCLKKQIYFIAKKELFDIPVFGWLISKTNAFPVDRAGSDVGALKNALKLLASGKILLVFPEGTRYKPGKIRNLKRGAAMLAVLANVPVVPVAVINSDKLLRLRKVKVRFGTPLKFNTSEDYVYNTNKIMAEIERLKAEG